MQLAKKFNTFSPSDYYDVIKNHKRYRNFNPLGLYRSLIENPKLDTATQLEILVFANQYFGKFYEFLVVKDIHLYAKLSRLGKEPLNHTQEYQYQEQLREQAKRILQAKKIRNWRVGIHTKSLRLVYDKENQQDIYVEIMTQKRSYKDINSSHVPHLKARKHKRVQIRQAIEASEDLQISPLFLQV